MITKPALADSSITEFAIPGDLSETCCGTIWHSIGFLDGNKHMANKIVEKTWEWTEGAKLPIVCDASSCTFGLTDEILPYLTLQNSERHGQLKIINSVAWAHDYLLPRLTINRKVKNVAIHPVCSVHHLNLAEQLRDLGSRLAENAVVPIMRRAVPSPEIGASYIQS